MYSVQIATEDTGENRVVERFGDVVDAVMDGLKLNAEIKIKSLGETAEESKQKVVTEEMIQAGKRALYEGEWSVSTGFCEWVANDLQHRCGIEDVLKATYLAMDSVAERLCRACGAEVSPGDGLCITCDPPKCRHGKPIGADCGLCDLTRPG